MANEKWQERCVWMARQMTELPSKRRLLTKISPSDGCKRDGVLLAMDQWYHFHEFGCHLLVWTAPDGIKRARMRSL
jgi:hypothetical protein